MSKPKTHKGTAKRMAVRRSKRNNTISLERRTAGQDHFNARETGKTRRNKRSDTMVSKTIQKTYLRALPHA